MTIKLIWPPASATAAIVPRHRGPGASEQRTPALQRGRRIQRGVRTRKHAGRRHVLRQRRRQAPDGQRGSSRMWWTRRNTSSSNIMTMWKNEKLELSAERGYRAGGSLSAWQAAREARYSGGGRLLFGPVEPVRRWKRARRRVRICHGSDDRARVRKEKAAQTRAGSCT